jgi:hypothetical protein
MQIRSINHNEGDQSFEEFASSMMKLVWESINHTEKQSTQYAVTLEKIS